MSAVHYAAATDIGKKRERNEDSFLVLELDRLFAVADGMGGHAGGDVAAKLAVETVAGFFQASRDPAWAWPVAPSAERSPTENRLVCAIQLANEKIFKAAKKPGRRGMGTTIVSAIVLERVACIAHAGDSRAYRFHDGRLEQITRDHSMLEEVKKLMPDMSEEDQRDFAHRNIVTRALGIAETCDVEVQLQPFLAGDRILMCSDGLCGYVDDERIADRMAAGKDPARTAADLVEEALREGGNDNVTVVVLDRV